MRACPNCGSPRVRRSVLRGPAELKVHRLRSPYRCRECRTRFWVISHKARTRMIALASVIMLAVAVWLVSPEEPGPAPTAPATAVDNAIELPHVRIDPGARVDIDAALLTR